MWAVIVLAVVLHRPPTTPPTYHPVRRVCAVYLNTDHGAHICRRWMWVRASPIPPGGLHGTNPGRPAL